MGGEICPKMVFNVPPTISPERICLSYLQNLQIAQENLKFENFFRSKRCCEYFVFFMGVIAGSSLLI